MLQPDLSTDLFDECHRKIYDYRMRISQNTNALLVLDHRPWAAGLILIFGLGGILYAALRVAQAGGAIFAAAVLVFAIPLVVMISIQTARTTITFDRNLQTVLMRRRSLLRRSVKEIPLRRVVSASAKTMRAYGTESSGDWYIIHITLTEPAERMSLTKPLALGKDPRPVARDVINGSQVSLLRWPHSALRK